MNKSGDLTRVTGVALAIFFSALSVFDAIYFLHINPGEPPITADLLSTQSVLSIAFLIGLPVIFATLGFWMTYLGNEINRGRQMKSGGFMLILLGILCLVISVTSLLTPAPSSLSERKGIGYLFGFGFFLIAAGIGLFRGHPRK
jgi:hypothetical protein